MTSHQSKFRPSPELWHKLKPLARQHRKEQTPAEKKLWERIRKRQIANARFRRQFVIERFIADFLCLEHRLIIEVDGNIHDQQQEYDAIRQEFLESLGFRVLRFTNDAVIHSIEDVLSIIEDMLNSRELVKR
jgi:very-short-patch-repair endonuclease